MVHKLEESRVTANHSKLYGPTAGYLDISTKTQNGFWYAHLQPTNNLVVAISWCCSCSAYPSIYAHLVVAIIGTQQAARLSKDIRL